ncbi:MAG TPA: YtxH domain-containing protein, partial [Gammaproteobacteria bacterium]
MNTTVTRLLIGVALTAGITYLLDPQSGRRRRATLREQVEKAAHKLNDGTRATRADLADRAQRLAGQCKSQAKSLAGQAKSMAGSVAGQAKSFVKPDLTRDDIVAARARAALRSSLSDSSTIGVAADQSRLILHGHVSPQEHETLRERLRDVAGSREVMDHLIERESTNGDAARRSPRRFDLSREQWDAAPRFLIGGLGAALIAFGIKQRSGLGLLGAAAAIPMIARSAMNKPLKRVGRGYGVIDVQKSIVVDAPVERVFSVLEKT